MERPTPFCKHPPPLRREWSVVRARTGNETAWLAARGRTIIPLAMNRRYRRVLVLGLPLAASVAAGIASAAPGPAALPVPPSRAVPVAETLHGETIVDPYRWLEDGASVDVTAWTEAQNTRTQRLLQAVPGRKALEARFWTLHETGSLGAPVPRPRGLGKDRRWRHFYTRREGKQNQPVLYVRDAGTRPGPDRALIDVNAMTVDGTRSLDWWFPSEDGALVAYGVSADGSEESVLRVRDVQTGRDLTDVIDRTRACSVAWLPDNSGFYYTRNPAPGTVPAGEQPYHRAVHLHRLGQAADADPKVFGAGRDHRDWPSVALSPNGRFLAVQVEQGWSRTELHVLDRAAPAPGRWHVIAAGEEAIFDLAEITDEALLVRANAGAPRYHLVRVPLPASSKQPPPTRSAWREVIPEGPHALQEVALVGRGQTLAALYLEDAVSRVRLFDLGGRPTGDVPLPELGTVAALSGHPEGDELFLPFTSFLSPTTILRTPLDRSSRSPATSGSAPPAPAVWLRLAAPLDPSAFVVTAERFRSKDGTEIPLFLIHRRDLRRDGQAPALLFGYGGFNVNVTPGWAPAIVPFLEHGGVYAVAVLRGGGEYGEAWHRAGMLGNKQNVFDDFIGAAEHLVAAKITRPERLAITGRSNGGLLMGAALTQRPELFRAVVCGVPLLDMLRYHRFRIAQLWIPEYGSPEDPRAYRWLRAYSPYHHVRDGVAYPAVLFTTAASDSRVDPLHARKMTARMQAAAPKSARPILLRLETKAGHGAGKPLGKVIAQLVDEWSFLFSELGMAPYGAGRD